MSTTSTRAFKRYEREVEELMGRPSPTSHEDEDDLDDLPVQREPEDSGHLHNDEDIEEWVQRAQRFHDSKKDADSELDEQDHPFAPRISMKSREMWEKCPQEPIHLRYEKEISKREKKIKMMKEDLEKEKKMKEETLLPVKDGKVQADGIPLTKAEKIEKKIKAERLSKKSKTPSIYERKNVYESSMSWLKNKDNKLAEQQSERLEEELANLHFQPRINRNNGYYSSISKSFEKRQKQFEEEKRQRQLRLEAEELQRYHHSPHINHKSKQLAEKKKIEEEIARKGEILEKIMRDEELRIRQEDDIWKSAPAKAPKDIWDSKTVSDFNGSLGNSIPIKSSIPIKKKGIHDLKSHEPRIGNKIIPKIPEDNLLASPTSYYTQGKAPAKELMRPAAPKRSIGTLSPSRLNQNHPQSPKTPTKSETLPQKKSPSRSPVLNDDRLRKSNPGTPQRKAFVPKLK